MRSPIKLNHSWPAAVLALILSGCAGAGQSIPPVEASAASNPAAALGQLPANFAGEIPCADCPGILYQLNLFPDQTFFQRMTYEDRDVTYYDIGRWRRRDESSVIELEGEGERPTLIRVVDNNTLHLLDAEGHEPASGLNYTLRRTAHFGRIEPRLTMSGVYRYFADAALFTECRTGLRLPVAQEADNVALERGYLAVRREPGEEVLVMVEGLIALRPGMDSDTLQPTLVVERFISAAPGETCAARAATGQPAAAPLVGTTWKLVALDDKPISVQDDERVPTLFLDLADHRVSGSGGCNRFGGSYTLAGTRLSFGVLFSTKMACATGMDLEQSYFAALEKVRSWRVSGRRLELYGAGGELQAGFEAG
jgi:copper homeostasis protein (lipoprotein)